MDSEELKKIAAKTTKECSDDIEEIEKPLIDGGVIGGPDNHLSEERQNELSKMIEEIEIKQGKRRK